jgi:hypothetical protein
MRQTSVLVPGRFHAIGAESPPDPAAMRVGLIASSQARRLRAFGLEMDSSFQAARGGRLRALPRFVLRGCLGEPAGFPPKRVWA